jgi:putative PIN family toxin of toxin-antitoxin system
MRLVLDTNVVVSAVLWGGVPRLLLQAGRERRASLFTSIPLLAELTDILVRLKFEKKLAASGLTIEQIVDRYAELASLVQPAAIAPTIFDDPDDDQVLACAMAARADLIVSGDRRHLLPMGIFEGMSIVSPAEALRIISV